MFKYNIIHILLFLIILCLLYTLLNDCGFKDGFSVGIPLCTQPIAITDYNDDVLNWSTEQNPYGKPMFDNDVSNYLDQGYCPTCQTYALVSCLTCLYNIQVYEWFLENNIDCENFTSITISPRSIVDIFYKYKYNINDYTRPCTDACGITDFTNDFYSSNSLLLYQYLYEHFNDGNYPLIKNHAVKSNGNNVGDEYMNINFCPSNSSHLFNETLESLNNPNFSYTNLFEPTDLLYINYGNVINISRDFNNQIRASGVFNADNDLTPRDVIDIASFLDRIKSEL